MKGIGPLGRELCKIFRRQVRRKIIKTLKETSTWTRHAFVQQQKICPSVADSLNGWQPEQTVSDEEYVHHNMMPEVVFEVTKPTYISLMKKALLQRCLKEATRSQNEAFNAIMIWIMWPKQGFAGAEVVELSAHLAAARINHRAVTLLAVLQKMGCTTRSFTESYVQLEEAYRVRKAEVKACKKQKYRRKPFRKRKKGFEKKACGCRGPNLWTWYLLTTIPVSDRCVFEPQTLCFLEECVSLRAR